MKANKPITTVKPTIFNIKTKSIPLPNSTSNPPASGVITSSMASLVKRGICTLTIVPTSRQATLTRKSDQLFEIYRQIRAKVPIHANTHFTRYWFYHRVSLMFHSVSFFMHASALHLGYSARGEIRPRKELRKIKRNL
uniref:Uncharacterized protein n=1 Tax=uncultured marine crenarchaeote E48-1C TaxID=907718 RepID=G9BAV7_9ARCH|nr:hypothetical protein E48-1C_37 [uncultured marine crenarchaeote E48-1C]